MYVWLRVWCLKQTPAPRLHAPDMLFLFLLVTALWPNSHIPYSPTVFFKRQQDAGCMKCSACLILNRIFGKKRSCWLKKQNALLCTEHCFIKFMNKSANQTDHMFCKRAIFRACGRKTTAGSLFLQGEKPWWSFLSLHAHCY